MNFYQNKEPSAPPRRKRSLSTSRYNSQESSHQQIFQDENFGFPNRMKSNFSAEHIPALYIQNPNSVPLFRPNNSILFAAMAGPLPRFLNSYSHPPSTNKIPVRPHYDYNKLVNVQYNPYQSKFNPTLMAKPLLENQSLQIPTSTIVANSSYRRDPMYNSRELNLSHDNLDDLSHHHVRFVQNKIPPARPPPPKLNSRLSMENLSSTTNSGFSKNSFTNDYEIVDRRIRNRRSLSPTRLSPNGQRTYIGRATSPLPSLNSNFSPTLSQSSLVNYRSSREGSRSPSPMKALFNYSKNLISPKSLHRPTLETSSNYNSAMSFNNGMNYYNKNNDNHNEFENIINERQINDRIIKNHSTNDQQFSQAFTDHCDQYKSVTSKILNSKKNTRLTGENENVNQEWNDGKIINKSNFSTDINYNMETNTTTNKPTIKHNDNLTENNNLETIFSEKLNEKLQNESKLQELRRNSSNSNVSLYQRKASLPAEYINSTNSEQLKLSEDWSRENIAHLAHEARERKLRSPSQMKKNIQKIAFWFTKQFIFLLICALNVFLAFMFYRLIAALPKE